MTNPIDFDADILDSRDVIDRLDDLRNMAEEFDEIAEGYEEDHATAIARLKAEEDTGFGHDERAELKALEEMENELSAYGDWEYGETIIAEDNFVAYTEQLIEDCYEMPNTEGKGWPYNHISIDYEAAAEELKGDYTECTIDGKTWLMRC